MSIDAVSSNSVFNTGLPLHPGVHDHSSDPALNALSIPLHSPSGSHFIDGSLSGGKYLEKTIDDLTGMPSSDTGGLPAFLRPPDLVHGDEFHSGIVPLDIAAHLMGTGMDKVESAASVTMDAVVDKVSQATQTFIDKTQALIDETREGWESPDNKLRQNLATGLEKSIVGARRWFNQFSNDPKVKATIAQLGDQVGERLLDLQEGLESLQAGAEVLLNHLHGQTDFISTSSQLATGTGAGGGSSGNLTLQEPDLTSDAYTTDNVFAQSGYAPASISSNSRLGDAKGNCTWYANGRAEELGADPHLLDMMRGNAYAWDDQAQAAGITISDRPQAGMVAIAPILFWVCTAIAWRF